MKLLKRPSLKVLLVLSLLHVGSFFFLTASVEIFISSSLPDEVIKTYFKEAQKHKGRLIMRGLVDGSMMKTRDYIEKLKVVVDIDPPLFEEYQVTVVPTLVIHQKGKVYKHTGNVPLSYVLEKIKERTQD